MHLLDANELSVYWSQPFLSANAFVLLNLVGALLLGMLVGYERTFHGRAAGMRTYGLVCMTSAGLTALMGLPGFWYGGHASAATGLDPSRVIQGVVTGIGFLGAGVIMKEGFHISGLTTAASIWASAAVGIMIGLGFYGAAIGLALTCAASMVWVRSLEDWLPGHPALAFRVVFQEGHVPQESTFHAFATRLGYTLIPDSLSIKHQEGQTEWQFVGAGSKTAQCASASHVAQTLSQLEGVASFSISPSNG